MSTQFNLNNNQQEFHSQNKVKVTDLLTRLNEEKKIEKKKKSCPRCRCSFCSNSFRNNLNNLIITYSKALKLGN